MFGLENIVDMNKVNYIASIFGVMADCAGGNDIKKKNKFKQHAIKTLYEPLGIDFPADWDELSDKEQARRLNGVLKLARNNKEPEIERDCMRCENTFKTTNKENADFCEKCRILVVYDG